MSVTAVNATNNSATLFSNATASRVPVQTLGQDDFLRLLVTQMTTQDPLNPTKDTDFIAQMAQFSSLEQARAMQANMASLRTDQQLTQANGLLGRVVNLQVDSSTTLSGVVSAVQVQSGTPKIVVNGTSYDLSQLLSIQPSPPQS